MKSMMFLVAFIAAVVSAQSSTVYAALPVLEACLGTTEGYVSYCSTTDYGCLCEKYTAILTCFDNCPSDTRESSYANQKQLYCMNASIYSSLTATASTTHSATVAADTTTTSTGTASTATSTSPQTSLATGSVNENGVDGLITNASGMLVVVAGVVAAVL
ncbi:hypothetical protein BJ170DRAFT_207476 [Xylariales sp. AK1849]|nr:hypothetical protein BJ170DRAFT_207476 [Xylariales sp. AK1849]